MPQAMPMQTGRVRTQAMTILPAMPHRTAERRLVAPTPRMAVETTWVVLTGRPQWLETRMMAGRRRFSGEAVNGFELQHLDAQGLDDLPSAEDRAEAHGQRADQDDPLRHIERLDLAGGEERHGDDAHGLLGVVGAVAEGHEGRREDLEPAEVLADDAGSEVTEEIQDQLHEADIR